jgi:hypothetical protein
MCCLRYEHEFYVQSRKRFPKEGKILVTANGEEQVVSNDIFGDRVTLRNSEGDIRVVPLAELRAAIERRGVGAAISQRGAREEMDDEAASDSDVEGELSAEDLSLPDAAPSDELRVRRSSTLAERASGERRPRRTRGRRGGRRHRGGEPGDSSTPTPRDRGRKPDRGEPEHPNED